MRSGKTKVIIDSACELYERHELKSVIVITPNGVQSTWARQELPKHTWDFLAWQVYPWVSKRIAKDRAKEKRRLKEFYRKLDQGWLTYFTVNMEMLTSEPVTKIITRLLKTGDVMLVVDESHHFGKPGAKRTRRVRTLAKRCKYRRIMSGSAILNSPLKAWSQFEILEPGALGFDKYTPFKYRYAQYEQTPQGYPRLLGYMNLDELQKNMARLSSVVTREDVDLQLLEETIRYVPMSEKQWTAYDAIKKNLLDELEDLEDLDFLEGAAKLTKLRQVLGGFVLHEGRTISIDDTPPRLTILPEEIGSLKTIIWSHFREDQKRVREYLIDKGFPVVHYEKADQAALESFRSGYAQVFIANPKSGGEGLDLSMADQMIWYTHDFDAEDRTQAMERASAIGRDQVPVVSLVAEGTVDEYLLDVTKNKVSIFDAIAGVGLKAYLKKILS
jgi:SNF2 family DNA or RNA helicase